MCQLRGSKIQKNFTGEGHALQGALSLAVPSPPSPQILPKQYSSPPPPSIFLNEALLKANVEVGIFILYYSICT